MLKNNRGVTLSILVVTIVVIMILASVTVTTSDLLIKDTKSKSIISNMYLVKGKIEAVYDDYAFNTPTNAGDILKGTPVSSSSVSQYYTSPATPPTNYWYKIEASDLPNLGMDRSMLSGTAFYYVNYETGEVIYSNGVKDSTGNVKYKLSDIKS